MEGRIYFIIAIVILLLGSCGESSFLTDLSLEDHRIEVTSHRPGSFLSSNEEMVFKITEERQNALPLNMDIKIFSMNKELLGSLSIENVETNKEVPLAPFQFLSTGYYQIEFQLLEASSIIQETSYQFFYIEGNYSIKSIETHPSTVSPDSPFILKSIIDSPEGSDPYLRWSMNGEIIAQGPESQGWNNLLWTSPDEEGVYSVLLELFPVAPFSGQYFSYKSSVTMEIEIYVIKENSSTKAELNPASSYYTLFHFDESLKDLGDKGISTSPESGSSFFMEKIGQPLLSEEDENAFYQVMPNSGFKYQGFVIPESQGMISPFTLTTALKINSAEAKNILSYLSDDASFGFSLFVDENASLKLEMKGLETKILTSGISIATLIDRFLLSLTIIPSQQSLTVIWYINGKALSTTTIPWETHSGSSQGVLTISGSQGFSGLVDELGIFYKDSSGRLTPDDQILKYSLTNPEGLLMISGFDGFYLHEGLTLRGSYKLEKSLLSLGQNASLIFPTFNLENQSIDFNLKLFEILNNDGDIELSFGNPAIPTIRIYMADKVYLKLNNTEYPLFLKDKSIGLKISAEKIEFLAADGKNTLLNLGTEQNNSVIISINNNAQYPLVIDSFTITR